MPGLTRSDEEGKGPRLPRFPRRLRQRFPRRLRRHHTAGVVSVLAIAAVLAAVLIPLALPNRAGISGAAARQRQDHPGATARTTPARATSAAAAPVHAATAPGSQATLTVSANAPATPVPGSWFGLSTEYWGVPLFARDMPVYERVLAMLHVQGDGPLVLRIGGDSADHSFWSPQARDMPRWAFALTPRFVATLRRLVVRDRIRLIIDLNLVTDTPFTAAEWARAAETSLPKGSIVGFEIGNEPDLYLRHYWMATIARSPFQNVSLPFQLTPSTYLTDFAAYARVLGEHAPDIPLIGPAVAHPRVGIDYIRMLIAYERSELGAVTGHLYPYSACVKDPRSSSYASVPRLLSWQASGGLVSDVASAVATAHDAGLKFRLTELNSVTCGGKYGVSNTFATALWAPDALFTLIRAGVDGANLHVRATAINAPFTINSGGLYARPLLYGLLLFTRTLGPQARLVRLQMSAPRALNLSAWAVRVRPNTLHVLLIDKGRRTVRVDLHLPASGPASVQRLLAASPYSRSGVTLNGQRLNAAGDWVGTPATETVIPVARGGYEITLPRHSAALLSVSLRWPARPGARARRVSEHHGRVAVAQHAVLAVGLYRTRKH
jgi:hypothetical protein